MNRHRALGYCLSMIFSENRCTLFRIMLWRTMLRIAARTMQARLSIRASPFETPAAQAPQGEEIEFACGARSRVDASHRPG
jgi:hypothetical protein